MVLSIFNNIKFYYIRRNNYNCNNDNINYNGDTTNVVYILEIEIT